MNIFKGIVFTSAMIFSSALLALEKYPQPFGLKWHLMEEDLVSLGFEKIHSQGDFSTLSSFATPKPWSQAEEYTTITYKGRLVKVVARSRVIDKDLNGAEGKVLYSQVKDLMISKYGDPAESIQTTGLVKHTDPDEFYQCLKYAGCGTYRTIFRYAGGTMVVGLEGIDRGEGRLVVVYESPSFAEAKRQFDQANLKQDRDAF